MNCPDCGYKYQFSYDDSCEDEDGKPINEEGKFFKLPITLERVVTFSFQVEREEVYGCPKCGNVFMDVE